MTRNGERTRITADEVRTAFGLTGVVHHPRYGTPHTRLDARTAHLLSTVGLPDTAWFMSRASLRADDYIDVPRWYRTRGTTPEKCHNWLVLGMLADTPLGLDPDSGTVHALGTGPTRMTCTPLHRDVESLLYTLTHFQTLLRTLEDDATDTEERLDALRAQITAFDPLPFADEEAQWHLIFEEVIDGIW
ncbi:SUKH-4 family immunity protein [Streptomyces sp. NPDC058955]|uniref:SUKH-4 family immunity protein n=1 Tax=unclassified Streptomyces TaxID=2593676 RepID=UPI00364FEBEA